MLKFFRKKNSLFILFLIGVSLISCQTENIITYEIKTTKGSILLELYPDKAPITVANFMHYVDKGIYTNSSFFRTCTPANEADREIQIQVIQGGFDDEARDLDAIKLETTKQTGIKHLDGTISMARLEPNTATNSFFICIGDQPSLDFAGKRNPDGKGFAAFGKVTKGMDVVLAIQKEKDTSQYLVKPVMIEFIKRIDIRRKTED
ncbi:MAG: peptidylprolyl isomerase [Urechidicola sp.]|nr:peptidylprolyl isomerase [Urechidicola sp.]